MKEYHGLVERGWDCVNSDCGKESVTITIPGSNTPPKITFIRNGVKVDTGDITVTPAPSPTPSYPGMLGHPGDIVIGSHVPVPTQDEAMKELIDALTKALEKQMWDAFQPQNPMTSTDDVALQTLSEFLYGDMEYQLDQLYPENMPVKKLAELHGLERFDDESEEDFRFRISAYFNA